MRYERAMTFDAHPLRTLAACVVMSAAAPLPAQEAGTEAARPQSVAVVEAWLDAWNRHDIEALAALLHPEVTWLSIEGDELRAEIHGAEALRDWATGYFREFPNAVTGASDFASAAGYVSFRETASWGEGNETFSQSSIAVYEVRDGAIRRAWYYSAE
jgi:ketosteroid isomerase-like protein